jgi:hypothetical protein
MASKKLKKALALGIGATLGAKFLGAKADAAKKLAQVDTGDLGSEMANDTALAQSMRRNMEAGQAAKKAKEASSFFGKAKKFLSDEVFTTNPKTKAFTIKKGPKSSQDFGLGMYDMNKGGMLKASNGMMVESRGNKLARTKITKLS